MTWMARGKCRELPPDTFFPSDGAGVEVARKICADCPVKSPCLEYAMENHIDHGVWGGTSERERRRIARRRRLAAAEAAAEAPGQVTPAAGPAMGDEEAPVELLDRS
jgi:WhiB family transcriptional regulator, redox-sensing transcriptional regulator